MKKAVALILVLVICLGLCACGGEKEAKWSFIIGTWEFENGYSLEFKEDNTGVMRKGDEELKITWKYDEELDCFPIVREGGMSTYNATYKIGEDGKITLIYGGVNGTKK